MVLIRLGIVHAKAQAGPLASCRQFFDYIAPKRAFRAGDFIIREFAVELTEAVVVFGREDDVFHASTPGNGNPLLRVEVRRVELPVQGVVFLCRDAATLIAVGARDTRPADLSAFETDRPPVNEQAESRISPPFGALRVRWQGCRCDRLGFLSIRYPA